MPKPPGEPSTLPTTNLPSSTVPTRSADGLPRCTSLAPQCVQVGPGSLEPKQAPHSTAAVMRAPARGSG